MDFAIEIDGKNVEAAANPWTLVVYEMEFSTRERAADMLQDFFGKGRGGEDDGDIVFDFTRTNWTAVAKAAWACVKAADPKTEPFPAWAGKVGEIPLFEASSVLGDAFARSFFRLGGGRDHPSEKKKGAR